MNVHNSVIISSDEEFLLQIKGFCHNSLATDNSKCAFTDQIVPFQITIEILCCSKHFQSDERHHHDILFTNMCNLL